MIQASSVPHTTSPIGPGAMHEGGSAELMTGEMSERVASFDWAATRFGPRSAWPASLAATVTLLLDSPVGMVLLWGPDALMIYNDGYRPIAGARHPDALGQSARDIWPEVWTWNQDVLRRAFAGEAFSCRNEAMSIARNGEPESVWFDLFYAPVRDGSGTPAGVLCTVIETTALALTSARASDVARQLASSEVRLGMLVNQASIGIAQSTLDGRLASVNERFASIVGRRTEDLIGMRVEDLTHPEDRDASRDLQAELLSTGRPFTAEKRLLRPDGRAVWVNNHVSLARDDMGRPDFVIRIVQDISDRKDAELRAQESSERIELALGAGAVLGTWVWNVQDDKVVGDARFARSFSMDPERARVGLPIAECLTSIHPDDLEFTRSAIDASLRNGGPFRVEYRLRQPRGNWLWVEANGHCERNAAGVPVRFPGVLVNIGHLRSAAERQAFLIALGDQLRTIEKPESVSVKAVEATARHIQAHVVGYGETTPDGRSIDLLAAWSDQEPIRLDRFPTAAFGPAAEALRRGEASTEGTYPLGAEDEQGQRRYDPVTVVPLFRDGRWQAVLFAAGPSGRSWTASEVDLLREVIGRTWDAMERARAVVTLRRAQSRQAFLLRLNDHLSELHEPQEVMETVAEALGSYLSVTRAAYGEVLLDSKMIALARDWTDGSVDSFEGSFSFDGIAEDDIAQLMRGLTVTEDDFSKRRSFPPLLAGALQRSKTRAALAVPLIRDGRLRAGLFLTQKEPRRWSLDEISLTQEVARRTWDALERTRAEAALQRSEANLRAMFATLPVGILFAELPSGRVTEANARVEEILGYAVGPGSADPAYGDWIAFDEADRQVAVEEHPLFLAVTTGETATRVFHHQRGDGSRLWISVVGAPVRGPDGRITGGLVTVVDIDREKRAESALRELNATLEQQVELRTRERDRIWQNSRDLLAVMGLDGTLYAVNPSWTTLLSWSADDLVGQRFEAFVHPTDVAPTFAAIEKIRRNTLNQPFENRYRSENGAYRWFSWTASVEGHVVYAVGRDVTAEKEQALALQQAEEQLRQSQKMEAVGQLTGGIAHDFNNLLTGITGALDLLAKRIEQGRLENTGRYIDMAMNSANRAASLTHRLLAFSRRQPLEAKPVDANRMVVSMDDLLRRTLGEKIELEVKVADDLWLTLCDPHQLENALLNLVINARDAMPDGGRLTIATNNAPFDQPAAAAEAGVKPGSYILLAVSDTGCGMSEDVIARAFDPFFTTKPIGQGTGLGLSMIYGFAKQSEGTVRITSAPDVGTTVRLYLPRHRGEVLEPEQQRVAPPRAESGETVLIVEDDLTVRTLVLEVLRELGYQALEAEDGPSGLRILDSGVHIDLLVTDVGLPGLNGRQLADRAREVRPDLKVLFITGYAENATFGGSHLDLGTQMITKPFAVEVLATKIKDMIAEG